MKLSPRPILKLPRSRLEWLCEALALIGLLLGLGIFIYYWPQLPASIPTHFDISGKPNDYGSKAVFVVFPMMALLMYGLILAVSQFPHSFNYPWAITESNAPTQYRLARTLLAWVKSCSIWLMAVLAWMTARTALGISDPAWPNFLILSCGLGIVAGIVVYFVRASRAK